MYTTKDFDERQKILSSHYKFECVCQPCTERWPSLASMKAEISLDPDDHRMNRFQKIRCVKCGETIRQVPVETFENGEARTRAVRS